jgi:hypothetical protein
MGPPCQLKICGQSLMHGFIPCFFGLTEEVFYPYNGVEIFDQTVVIVGLVSCSLILLWYGGGF